MSDTTFDYVGEDSKNYKIIIGTTKDGDLFINIFGVQNSADIYSSNYFLSNLNEKFNNIIKLKTINDFKTLCEENIKKKTLILKSPYKSVINTIWKTFPNDKSKNNTFTLISSKSSSKKISIYSFSNYSKVKNVVEELKKQLSLEISKTVLVKNGPKEDCITFQDNFILDKIYFLTGNYSDNKTKENDFIKLLESNNKIDFGFRKLLILFDEDKNILDFMVKLVKKFYQNQIFILFFTNKIINDFRLEIDSKLYNLKETYLSYFNTDNIYINENSNLGYKRSVFPLLKVYCYFNQLGDGFYKKLITENYKIEGLEEEVKHLFLTHYFNILLCGRTGVGKSTFINQIMGEKKSFTLKTKSIGTERNNFYIHKDYPIKIIDVCGFAEGNESKENLEKLNMIYKKESLNILIDEPMNDIFSFYGDKRNNIHLLIYFNVYEDRYDIFPGELPVMYDIKEKKIPIIFVVNKCKDEVFEDEEDRNLLTQEVLSARKGTDFENNKTYYINCLKGKGFDQLLKGIFEEFKNHIIKDDDLDKIKDFSMPIDKFNNLFEHSFFFGNISPKDVFLNESLVESVLDIKKLIVKLAGYYSGDLGCLDSLSFYFCNKLYNQIWRNSTKNFFPLLTDLVKKIYSNFGIEKNYEECNNFIKKIISRYFNLNNENNHNNTVNEEIRSPTGNEDDAPYTFTIEQFSKDYINLVKLYWYSKENFRTNDNIQENILKQGNTIEEKLFTFKDENKIDSERLLLLVKRDFGLDNSKRDATSKEKIFQKLFYISYTCNELISSLCGQINYKEIKYTSIFNFYHIVSLSYNKAIKGFLDIDKEMKKKEKDLKKFLGEEDEDDEAPPVQ